MPIEKAIEFLTYYLLTHVSFSNHDINSAVNLGIEALKVVKILREEGIYGAGYLLPGETTSYEEYQKSERR